MTPEAQAAFLVSTKTLILSSIDSSGYPHSVAMWFSLIDGIVHMTTFRKSQRSSTDDAIPRSRCSPNRGLGTRSFAG